MSLITLLTLLFFLMLIGAGLSIVYWSIKNGISPMPTSPKVASQLLSALPKDAKGTIYELGAGWGNLAFPLARKYPQCTIEAIESSPLPYFFCCLRLRLFPHSNLILKRQNFFDIPLNNATIVICYLYPGAMCMLKDKFEQELAPGTLVVSNTFGIPAWKPVKVIDSLDLYHTLIYLYEKKKIHD